MPPRPDPYPSDRRVPGAARALAGEGLRMGLLSAASLALGYVLTFVLHDMAGAPVEAAYTCAVLVCSLLNFFGCRHYVFRGAKGTLLVEAARFFPSILLFRAAEVVLFSALTRLLDNYHLAYVATAVISMAFKLLLSRIFIFKRSG